TTTRSTRSASPPSTPTIRSPRGTSSRASPRAGTSRRSRSRSSTPTPTRGERSPRDRDLARLRLGPLADRQGEHAAIEPGLDALAVGHVGQREAARERAELALVERVGLALLALLGLTAARDRHDVVVDGDVEIRLDDAGEIGLQHERVVGLLDLERGRERADRAAAEERVPRQDLAGDGERIAVAGGGRGRGSRTGTECERHQRSSCEGKKGSEPREGSRNEASPPLSTRRSGATA